MSGMPDPLRIIVLGAGGNSLSILDAIAACNAAMPGRYQLEGILDDLPENQGREVLGHRVLGRIDEAHRFAGCRFVNGISSIASFRKMPAVIARTGLGASAFESVIHPRATISPSARIGAGSVVMAGSVVCAEASLGDHVIVLQNTSINHHTLVGDYATLSAGITVLGYVEIGRNAFVGGGSTVAPRCHIGEGAIVGAGSVVIREVAPGKVYAGNPAREISGSRHAAH